MSTQSIQVAISLLTILGSGVVSAIVTYSLTKRREETALYRQKLEQLYLASTRFVELLGAQFLLYCTGITGKLTMDQINDRTIARGKDDDRSFRTASMMIAIYFPELHPVFDRILKARTAGNDVFSDFHYGYTHDGWDGPKLHATLMSVIQELEAAENAMTAAIHATARRICGDRAKGGSKGELPPPTRA